MVGMGEHIDRLHGSDPIIGVEQRQVARLRGGIATHINDARRSGPPDHLDDRLIDTRTRRIENNDVGVPVGSDEASSNTAFISPA